VRVGERVGHLARNARRVAHREPLVRAEQLAQRRSVDAPHDDVEHFLVPACEVPVANVVGDVGLGYKVAIETLNTGRIGIGRR